MRTPLRERHKGSNLDTNQKQLTTNAKVLYYTANDDTTVQLAMYQQIVIVTNSNAFVLSLPSVAEAKGISYTISVTETGQAVTLTDSPNDSYSDSIDWPGDYTLDAEGDSIELRSDGRSWTVVSNDIT